MIDVLIQEDHVERTDDETLTNQVYLDVDLGKAVCVMVRLVSTRLLLLVL